MPAELHSQPVPTIAAVTQQVHQGIFSAKMALQHLGPVLFSTNPEDIIDYL